MEQRAVTVITTSGVLVTLLFALVGVFTARDDFALPDRARPALIAGLAFFVLAAICALIVNLPRGHDAPSIEGLKRVLKHQWHDEPWVARRRVGLTRVIVIESYKKQNETKGFYLKLAIGAEALGVASIAVAVALIVVTS
jgi:hypothetical protein